MQGIFQYNNVLCLVILHQQVHIGRPYNQRFELQDLLPVLPSTGQYKCT